MFKRPFEYAGKTYTELTFNFERMTGRDMVAIEDEMQMNNEYALAPEISRSFQAKMAAKAAGIGSDVLDAMPGPLVAAGVLQTGAGHVYTREFLA